MYIKYIFAAEVIFKNTFILKAVHLQIIISNSGHYQSIQPSENNQIIRHYRWTKNRSQSRLCSVGEPIGCSSRISSKKRCYDEKECGEQSTGKRPRLSTYDTSDAMESIIGSSSRKIATGCHICSNLFKKKAVKKSVLAACIATKNVWVIAPIWPTFRSVSYSICIVYNIWMYFCIGIYV